MRWILKKLLTSGWPGETILISSWKCNYSIYLDIQAISTLICLVLIFNYQFFCNTCLYKQLTWKLMFPVTSKPTTPTVFNLQASNWVHCEEETGAHTGVTRQIYKLLNLFLMTFLKLFILYKKNTRISKSSLKFIIHYNWKKVIAVYIYISKRRFIFYSSFSLRSTENIHEQKHFLERWYSSFV